ncbi:unnamed protein product [Closterium sp. NIES-65]|nr:unnamed protein product [Closterium sp. NIES-65]
MFPIWRRRVERVSRDVWLGAAWLGAAWLGAAWLGAAWLGAAWLGAAWLGAAWLGGVTRLAGRHLPALHAGPKLDQFPSPAFSRSATRSSTLDSNSAVRIGSIATSRVHHCCCTSLNHRLTASPPCPSPLPLRSSYPTLSSPSSPLPFPSAFVTCLSPSPPPSCSPSPPTFPSSLTHPPAHPPFPSASPSPFPSLHVDRLPYTLHASNRMPIFPYPPIPASPSFNHPTFPPPLLPPIPSSPPPPPPLPLSPTLNLAVARHSQVGLLDADVFAPHCPTCLACTLSPPPPSCPLGLETAGCPLLASPFPHACRRTACSACPLTWAGSVGFLMPAHVATQGGTTGEGQQGRGGSASKATLPAHALSSAGDAHAPMRSLPPAARADENGGAMDVVVVMMAMDATSSAGSTKALECDGQSDNGRCLTLGASAAAASGREGGATDSGDSCRRGSSRWRGKRWGVRKKGWGGGGDGGREGGWVLGKGRVSRGKRTEEGTDAGSGVLEAAVVVRYERLVSGSVFLALPTVPTPLCLPGHCLPCQHTHPTDPCMRRSSVHPPQLPAVSPTPFSPTPCAHLTNALFTNTMRPSHQRPFHQHHAPVSPTPFPPTPCACLTNALFTNTMRPSHQRPFHQLPLLPTYHSSDPFITSSAFDVVTPGGVVSGVCHGLPAMEGLHSWQVELACRVEGRGGAGGERAATETALFREAAWGMRVMPAETVKAAVGGQCGGRGMA